MQQLANTATAAGMTAIEVSPEMTALIGPGAWGQPPVPADPVALVFRLGGDGRQPSLRVHARPELPLASADEGFSLVFLVARDAVERLGGAALLSADGALFHLPSELRAIAVALRDAAVPGAAVTTYRLAKSIELLCECIRLHQSGALVAVACDRGLSPADTLRLVAARDLIQQRWNEKLTLDGIARSVGINRAKLTRGFREMFDCSVAEAIAQKRLEEARRLLLTTDKPVSLVGYEAGYLNNASFARAFGRHFGRPPSHYRAQGVAA